MTYSKALKEMKKGRTVARKGWNGKGMYVFIVLREDELLSKIDKWTLQPKGTWEPFFVMKTAQDTLQPGWLASQADMLANDWEIV